MEKAYKWVGHVARMGNTRNACRFFLEKRALRRPRGWVDSFKLDRLWGTGDGWKLSLLSLAISAVLLPEWWLVTELQELT